MNMMICCRSLKCLLNIQYTYANKPHRRHFLRIHCSDHGKFLYQILGGYDKTIFNNLAYARHNFEHVEFLYYGWLHELLDIENA